jgi:hypothetical protein
MSVYDHPSWLSESPDDPTHAVVHVTVSPLIIPISTCDPVAAAAELKALMHVTIDGKKHEVIWKWDPQDPVDGCAESYTLIAVEDPVTFPKKHANLIALTDATWKTLGKEYRKAIRGVRGHHRPALIGCICVNIFCLVLVCLFNPILLLVYIVSLMPMTCLILSCYQNASIVGPAMKAFVVDSNKVLNGTPIFMHRVDKHVGLTQGKNNSDYVFLFVKRRGPNNV